LPALIILKIAAGRARDESDVVELLRTNKERVAALRSEVVNAHSDYGAIFDRLAQHALEEDR
jgi:hypothetical protein